MAAPGPVATAAVPEERTSWRSVGNWRGWLSFAITLAAFGVSMYLTLAHYDAGAVRLVCPEKGFVNCSEVTTSPQSEVFGVIPVALIGLIFYAGMCVINFPSMWRTHWRAIAYARLAGVVGGIAMVIYLLSAELFSIHAICIYCTTVHALTFILFMLVVTGWEDATAGWRETAA
jgi:uncharacterized membrane protein